MRNEERKALQIPAPKGEAATDTGKSPQRLAGWFFPSLPPDAVDELKAHHISPSRVVRSKRGAGREAGGKGCCK